MDNDIQLISDGEGLVVIGNAADVDRFLVGEGLSSTDLGPHALRSLLGVGATAAQVGSDIAENSARWVKLSRKSAAFAKKHGLRESASTGLSTGVLKGPKGQVKGFLEFVKTPRARLTNPANLAAAGALLAQFAAKQAMEEITDYLAVIDEKVEDVLRAQTDTALSRMIGAGLVLEDALTLREAKGRVDEITWSKVQTAPTTIAETQAYALRQLDAVAAKMERKSKIGDLAAVAKEAESKAREWLAVLARCVQLQDAVDVVELDRVMDASPAELDGHRLGLKAAREARLDLIARNTERLVARMNEAAGTANAKVLLHPAKSPAVVESSNQVVAGVVEFHERLGIESGRESAETRRWVHAAADVRDRALETGAKGVDAARGLGTETLDRAGTAVGKLSTGIAERTRRLRGEREESGAAGESTQG